MNEQIIQQLHFYEYLGKAYQHGLYEMVTKSNHECYSNKEDLYDYISEILSNNL